VLLVAAPLSAQQDAADPLYHVEIVVFEQIDSSRAEEDFYHGLDSPLDSPAPTRLRLPDIEIETLFGYEPRGARVPVPPPAAVPDEPGNPLPAGLGADAAPVPTDALELFELTDTRRTDLIRFAGPLPDQFRVLTAEELELGDVRADLYRRREYRVLGHAGWAQTGVDDADATPVDLRLLGITNPSGTIKVYVRRFLHAAIDLEFTDGSGTYWRSFAGSGAELLEHARRYRNVFEHNAIRSGELVYIDHPLFGLFIRITPAPEPEETGPATEGGPAA